MRTRSPIVAFLLLLGGCYASSSSTDAAADVDSTEAEGRSDAEADSRDVRDLPDSPDEGRADDGGGDDGDTCTPDRMCHVDFPCRDDSICADDHTIHICRSIPCWAPLACGDACCDGAMCLEARDDPVACPGGTICLETPTGGGWWGDGRIADCLPPPPDPSTDAGVDAGADVPDVDYDAWSRPNLDAVYCM